MQRCAYRYPDGWRCNHLRMAHGMLLPGGLRALTDHAYVEGVE